MSDALQPLAPNEPQQFGYTARHIGIYARISRDPSGKAIGVLDQAKQCREKIAREFPGAAIITPACTCARCVRDGVPPDVYCDNDLGAGKEHIRRPHYDRLVDDIKNGIIDALVTVDTDRLYRNLWDLKDYIDACESRGVPTYTVKAGIIDLSTPSGRAFACMGAIMARYEWEQMVGRQRQAKRRDREAGKRTSTAPHFGYRRGEGATLIVAEDEADAIRQAYQDAIAGISLIEISRQWNEAGFRGRGGVLMRSNTVRSVLLRASNAGLVEYPALRPGKGQIVGKGQWPAIIDEDTYYRVRAILTDPKRKTSPGVKPANLLTGVLICGGCGGGGFVTHVTRNGRGRQYRCRTGLDDGKTLAERRSTVHVAREMGPLDEFVEAALIRKLGEPATLDELDRPPDVEMEKLRGRLGALEGRLAEFKRLATAGDITPGEYLEFRRDLWPKIEAAQKAVFDAEAPPGLTSGELDALRAGTHPGELWEAMTLERKRTLLKTLLRIRLLPAGHGGRRVKSATCFNPDAVEILWWDQWDADTPSLRA